METKISSKVKTVVLLAFILSSVFLVMGVWVEGLTDQEPAVPGHIRPTLAWSTPQGFELTLTANPDSSDHRQGTGEGQGEGLGHSTPTPTVDLMNLPTEDLPADLLDE
ncbi:MAG: hypothetical protein PVG14_08095 [Anaerolineales bacterium]|jgi:hypothetical protein